MRISSTSRTERSSRRAMACATLVFPTPALPPINNTRHPGCLLWDCCMNALSLLCARAIDDDWTPAPIVSNVYIQMQRPVIAIDGIASAIDQVAVIVKREPEQHLCARRELQMIVPVVQPAGTRYAEQPGAAIVVDGIWHEPVADR